jgi:hypothetical protein
LFQIIFAFFIKLIRPVLLIRWARLDNAKFGHFATNVEIYLLEKKFAIDKPKENVLPDPRKGDTMSVKVKGTAEGSQLRKLLNELHSDEEQ